MFKSKTDAKEDFKKLIVETMKNAKDNYSSLKYSQFINSVIMLDSFMGSYKNDPIFLVKAQSLNITNKTEKQKMMISQLEGIGSSQTEQTKSYFLNWFNILVDLATRSVFAGIMTNVDIDLAEVWNDWKQMTGLEPEKIESGLVDISEIDTHEDIIETPDESLETEEVIE